MRTLRLVISRAREGLPKLLLATVLPAGAAASCSGSAVVDGGPGGGTDAGGSPNAGSGGSAGGGQAGGTAGSGGIDAGGPDAGFSCDDIGAFETTFDVPVPPEGVPATPDAICRAPREPVQSNRAARITLHAYAASLHVATGRIEMVPSLLDKVVGTPTVSVVEAQEAILMGMQVTSVQPAPGGFTFDAQWPLPFDVQPYPWMAMNVMTSFDMVCGDGSTRTVESMTTIHLCTDLGAMQWVSSGDVCTACDPYLEMIPSPLVPNTNSGQLPLSRALRLAIRTVARIGRALVLLAEHDGGMGFDYAWHASAGALERLAPDLAVWTLPTEPGPHLVQVAAQAADAAAVASLRWNRGS